MKLMSLIIAVSLVTLSTFAAAAEGLVAVRSPHSVAATMDRVEAQAKQRGLNVFARIDHAAGAAKIGKTLRPTQVIIFGNPQGGTPFMECAQTVGIDLPLKVLVWEDGMGQVWLGYNDPGFIAKRHDAENCSAVTNLNKALQGLSKASVAP